MRPTLIITSLNVLFFCWLAGIEMGLTHVHQEKTVREEPYRAVMLEAVATLQSFGYTVPNPEELPAILPCTACLEKREAFGAYSESLGGVYVPDNFDLTTLDGKSQLIHEYGHFLLTKAGVPADQQERLCLALGNSVFQKFFKTASN